jgi:hypothetical protein
MTATENAKRIINIIALEVRLQQDRVEAGYITSVNAPKIVLERLMTKAKSDVNLKTFLTTMAYVPEDEDTRDDVDWAEDRRDPRAHVITDREHEEAVGFPMPGERVC